MTSAMQHCFHHKSLVVRIFPNNLRAVQRRMGSSLYAITKTTNFDA
jgi:hypothetical protein